MEIEIDYEKCPPCSELKCVDNCPWGVFQADVDTKPKIADAASCVLCGICEEICPFKAIKVKKEKST